MNPTSFSSMVENLGWMLLHFLWQGMVIAFLIWVFFRLAKKSSPQVRYGAAGVALLLMLSCAAGTLAWQIQQPAVAAAKTPAPQMSERPSSLNPDSPRAASGTLAAREAIAGSPRQDTVETILPRLEAEVSKPSTVAGSLRPLLPWMVTLWAAGVAFFSVRLMNGWRMVKRWRLSGSDSVPDDWPQRFAELCHRLRLTKTVRLLSSASLAVPVVIGWLKPVVLVPAGLFTGLTAAQLEALLAHELAHVRRHDYLVNLLQNVLETLFFYHPAVWWVSAQLRKEREHCCDDVACTHSGGVLDYAKALTALEEMRGFTPLLSMSATGGSLLQRVRRLAGISEQRTAGFAWPIGLITLGAVALALPLTLLYAEEKPFSAPQAAHTSTGNRSAYCVHDGNQTQFVLIGETPFSSSTSSGSNPVSRTWHDDGKLTFDGGGAVTFARKSERPDTLQLKIQTRAGLNFKAETFDLRKGRVFLIAPDRTPQQLSHKSAPATTIEAMEALSRELSAKMNPLQINIAADGALQVDGDRLDEQTLRDKVTAAAKENWERRVLIYPDSSVGMKRLASLVKLIQDAGLKRVVLQVRPEVKMPDSDTVLLNGEAIDKDSLKVLLTAIARRPVKTILQVEAGAGKSLAELLRLVDGTGIEEISLIKTPEPPGLFEVLPMPEGAQDKAESLTGAKRTVFHHIDGSRTESYRVESRNEVREYSFNEAGDFTGLRLFVSDSKGELRRGFLFDSAMLPMGSVDFGYSKENESPVEERHYNKKGQLVRRVFFPPAVGPETGGGFPAFNYDPSNPQLAPVRTSVKATRFFPESAETEQPLAKVETPRPETPDEHRQSQIDKLLRAGYNYRSIGQFEEARKAFEKVGTLDPKNPAAIAGVTSLEEEERKIEEGRERAWMPIRITLNPDGTTSFSQNFTGWSTREDVERSAGMLRSIYEQSRNERPPLEFPGAATLVPRPLDIFNPADMKWLDRVPGILYEPWPPANAGSSILGGPAQKPPRFSEVPADPVVQPASSKKRDIPMGLVIRKDGTLRLSGKVMELEEIKSRLRSLAREASVAALVIQPDEGVEYRRVIEVMNAAREAGVTQIGMATRAGDYPKSARLQILEDGNLKLNRESIDDATLKTKLEEFAKENRERPLMIIGFKEAPYRRVIQVLEIAAQAGLTNVGLSTAAVKSVSVTISGDVNRPGVYKLPDDGITVQGAIRAAGDFNSKADRNSITLTRNNENQENAKPEFGVEDGDVIFVGQVAGDPNAPKISKPDPDPFSVPSDPEKFAEARKTGLMLNVVDADGRKPLAEFRVIAGVKSSVGGPKDKDVVNWQPHTLRMGRNGGMIWPLNKAYDVMALRVEAEGYEPQVYSWIEKSKGPQDLNFQMTQTRKITGVALFPSGKPAAGATVALAMVQRDAVIEGGKLRLEGTPKPERPSDQWRWPVIVKADGSGRFELPAENDATAALLVIHENGVREISLADFKKGPDGFIRDGGEATRIRLQPWGRIEGKVMWGENSGADQKVNLSIHRDSYGYPGVIAQYEKTRAQADGSFVFDRVLPGLAQISCPISAGANGSGFTEVNLTGQTTHVTVTPGTTPVLLGGGGRTVKGKLTGRDSWEGVTFHFHPTAPHIGFPGDDEIWKAWSEFQKSPIGPKFFRSGLKVNADGTFEIPNVLPGSYQIFFSQEAVPGHVASSKFTVDAEVPLVKPEAITIPDIQAAPTVPALPNPNEPEKKKTGQVPGKGIPVLENIPLIDRLFRLPEENPAPVPR